MRCVSVCNISANAVFFMIPWVTQGSRSLLVVSAGDHCYISALTWFVLNQLPQMAWKSDLKLFSLDLFSHWGLTEVANPNEINKIQKQICVCLVEYVGEKENGKIRRQGSSFRPSIVNSQIIDSQRWPANEFSDLKEMADFLPKRWLWISKEVASAFQKGGFGFFCPRIAFTWINKNKTKK